MGAIQNSLGAINTQLADLTSTAKLLIGALMVILTMSLFFVAQYAGRPSMVMGTGECSTNRCTKASTWWRGTGGSAPPSSARMSTGNAASRGRITPATSRNPGPASMAHLEASWRAAFGPRTKRAGLHPY